MAQPGIPGLDVTEISGSRAVLDPKRPNFTIPETPRDFSQGTRTPNLPAVDNRPNFTMPRGPSPENLSTGARQAFDFEASQPSRFQQGMRAVRQAGASALESVPGSLRTVGRAVGKTAAPLLGIGTAMEGGAPDSTARYAKRFGVDEPTGDGSIGDIAKFVGLRAGGFASDLGNAMTMGLAGKFYADNQPGAMPAQPNVPAAPPVAPSGLNPQDAHFADGTRTSPLAPTYAAPRENYGIRGVPVTETLGFDGYKRQLDNIRSLGPTSDAVGAGAAGIGNSRAGSKPSAWYEPLGMSRTDLLGLRPRDIRHLQGLAQEERSAARRADTDTNIAGMRESGEMARANLSANTQRAINERQVELGLRGQDITREGHMISAQGQRARLMYDMGKDQRDYVAQRGDKDFEHQQGREKQLQSNIESMNTFMDGDKAVVNAPAAAAMRQGIDRAVARLGLKGVHELEPRAEQQLMAASKLMQTMRENAGWLPWKPDKLKTIDPLDLTALKVLPNGDRQITRKGQAMGQIIPARFFQTEEGVRFFGGTPTNRYDILSEGSN